MEENVYKNDFNLDSEKAESCHNDFLVFIIFLSLSSLISEMIPMSKLQWRFHFKDFLVIKHSMMKLSYNEHSVITN